MPGYIRKFNIIVATVVLICLAIVLATPRSPEPCWLFQKDGQKNYILADSLHGVDSAVIKDARETAESIYGKDPAGVEEYLHQLIGIYQRCTEIDTLIIFNAGGFGWDSIADAQGWISVMEGIESFFENVGEKAMVVNFERTRSSVEGILTEVSAFWGAYPVKSIDLAGRISFLTRNLPDIKVLLAGESNGATIIEEAFCLLADNPRVFAIQTGPTVLQENKRHEHSLVMRHNGKIDDSFSNGDLLTILLSNLEAMVGIYQEYPGNILFYIGAPGHHYTWKYPEFRADVLDFLSCHFT